MCNWKQMGIALGTGFATSVALINTCSVAYAEAPQEFCLDPDKTKTSIPGDDMSEDDASQTVVSSTTWGIPYHLDWDGRHEQAHRRGITSRSTRLTRQILLVRHGEYVHAESGKDVDRILTEKGRSQAFRVGKYIQQSLRENPLLTGAVKVMGDSSEVNPRRLVVSGLTRAQQTAREILPFLPPRTPVVELSNMNEGIPCPPDPPLARLSKISHKEQRKSAERIENAFNSIFYRPLTKEDEGIDIVVGHANVFRYFICRILQVPPEAWLRMTLGHCSVTRISIYSTGHIKIECVGDVGFLPPDMHTV